VNNSKRIQRGCKQGPLLISLMLLVSIVGLTACSSKNTPSPSETKMHLVGAPDGRMYSVEAPLGASREQIISELLEEHPEIASNRKYQSAQRIGDFTFYDNGTSSTRIGDTTFYSDGASSTRIGDTEFYSDGSTSSKIGDTTFHSDGTSATQIGDSTFHSDGTICQTIGDSTFCN
jgi:hypothetical protein